ncbi:hypothetical protein FJY68_06690 [candidate division WOR-3 bacterium]|uniref:Porin n=1 Tax=candidate division WOR-3 bacterium TaxID=2052148 RepID=A0A937XI68_UNCW3|nr:hypothetical protein [candidate division WOR-3 bacterium]
MSRLRNFGFGIMILLAAASSAQADLDLAGDRLVLDATVWTSGHVWMAEEGGLSRNELAFERVDAVAGLTGRVTPGVSFRLSADVGRAEPRDLYLSLTWRGRLGLRAGQFLQPLGMDAMTEPDSQILSGNALLISYAKPLGTRDIGILGTWDADRISVAAAVINGSGPNAGEANGRKDLCARVAVRPASTANATLALRAYHGWPGASETAWQTVAFEASAARGPLELQAEFQNHQGPDARNNAGYVQAYLSTGQLQPVARLDLVLPSRKRADWMATAGINVRPFSACDAFRVLLSCSYRRNYQDNWSFLAFLVRLQAAI